MGNNGLRISILTLIFAQKNLLPRQILQKHFGTNIVKSRTCIAYKTLTHFYKVPEMTLIPTTATTIPSGYTRFKNVITACVHEVWLTQNALKLTKINVNGTIIKMRKENSLIQNVPRKTRWMLGCLTRHFSLEFSIFKSISKFMTKHICMFKSMKIGWLL